MKLAIHDPEPWRNDYVSLRFIQPLEQFARNNSVSVKRIADPIPEFGWTMLCNAGHLSRELIQHFHANRCAIVAISCNDSAYLTEELQHPDLALVPLVFTISGVQRTNFSKQSVMNPDMTVSTRDVRYLTDEAWALYDDMVCAERILPLPYVPWDRLEEVQVPDHKSPTILFRGGNHFWRFIAYLHALKAGVADSNSGFLTQDYFSDGPEMQERFRFCQKCREQWKSNGERLFVDSTLSDCECPGNSYSDAENDPLSMNNRTPRQFFEVAYRFRNNFGEIPMQSVEQALNFRRQSPREHLQAVANAAFFCDAKWEFSIPFPQRFFEAASVGTVNLVPRRSNDQDYFPRMKDCEHYLTFADDFSDFGGSCFFNKPEIARNTKELYDHWIRPGYQYVTNENLLSYMLSKITEVGA